MARLVDVLLVFVLLGTGVYGWGRQALRSIAVGVRDEVLEGVSSLALRQWPDLVRAVVQAATDALEAALVQAGVIVVVVTFAYEVGFNVGVGGTPGKLLFGLRVDCGSALLVVNVARRAVRGAFVWCPSWALCLGGIILFHTWVIAAMLLGVAVLLVTGQLLYAVRCLQSPVDVLTESRVVDSGSHPPSDRDAAQPAGRPPGRPGTEPHRLDPEEIRGQHLADWTLGDDLGQEDPSRAGRAEDPWID